MQKTSKLDISSASTTATTAEYDDIYLNHCQILGLTLEKAKIFKNLKSAFTELSRKYTLNKPKRIQINFAYEYIGKKICGMKYSVLQNKIIRAIIEGDVQTLNNLFNEDRYLMNFRTKTADYPIVYLAARSGNYNVVEFILKMGCSLDFSKDKSTPMHCAAYYGHYQIITLLLQYGVPLKSKNYFGNTPQQQAATQQIRTLLSNAHKNLIYQLTQSLIQQKVAVSTFNIYLNGQVMATKIVLNNYFKQVSNFQNTFHGTSFKNLKSIAKYGLKKPGDVIDEFQISIVKGHFQEGRKYQQTQNWAIAIFVTPSIYYACHPCYSKQIINNNNQIWLPVVQAKVHKQSYTKHGPTTHNYKHKTNQPQDVEYRIGFEAQKNGKGVPQITEKISEKVIVVSLILVRKGQVQKYKDFNQITNLLLNSDQQKKFQKSIQLCDSFSNLSFSNE